MRRKISKWGGKRVHLGDCVVYFIKMTLNTAIWHKKNICENVRMMTWVSCYKKNKSFNKAIYRLNTPVFLQIREIIDLSTPRNHDRKVCHTTLRRINIERIIKDTPSHQNMTPLIKISNPIDRERLQTQMHFIRIIMRCTFFWCGCVGMVCSVCFYWKLCVQCLCTFQVVIWQKGRRLCSNSIHLQEASIYC
jgi:hypothetical protein